MPTPKMNYDLNASTDYSRLDSFATGGSRTDIEQKAKDIFGKDRVRTVTYAIDRRNEAIAKYRKEKVDKEETTKVDDEERSASI
jgi:hypothetical protein